MDNLIHTIAKESVYKELEKSGLDPNNFTVSLFEQEGYYNTFRGRIFFNGVTGSIEVGSYQVLIIPGEEFPEAGEAQVTLSMGKIKKCEVNP